VTEADGGADAGAEADAGTPGPTTLLEVLRRRFPEASTRTLRQMLETDRVRVNGAPERVAKRPVAATDHVEVVSKRPPLDPRVRVIYEDDDLVVVDKAAGLLTVPSPVMLHETAESFLNVNAGARRGEQRIFHVHRIDRDTSGVLVFAKSEFLRDRLQVLFAAHDIDRRYVAVVFGKPKPPSGTLRDFLLEDADLRVRRVANEALGKEAITHYRTIASGRRLAMLEVRLETGRRHQIRVQLADLGHPVVGDAMYARGREDPLGRLGLHARHLGFVHPLTGKSMSFEAPLPAEIQNLQL
jgi:23S rRNA pseudouridine1911/1915/1917 synthase